MSRRPLLLVSAALSAALLATAVPALRHLREMPPPRPDPLRAIWAVPPDLSVGSGAEFPFGLAVGPDGRLVAFPATRDGRIQLWLQNLRTGELSALPDTDGAALPFWMPDGSRIGFFSGTSLMSFDVEAARVDELMPVGAAGGASWNHRGDLIVAPSDDGGVTLRAADGTVRAITTPDTAAGEVAHRFPVFLPDGEHFVFFVKADDSARQGVWLGSLLEGAGRDRLVGGVAQAIVAGGHLLFANDGTLVAQSLDLKARRLTGPVTVLGLSVGHTQPGQLLASAADDTLVYSPPASSLRQLVWLSRQGERLDTLGAPADAWSVRIAPDGIRALATVRDPLLRTLDVVLFGGVNLMPSRVSLSIDADEWPAWSPDGLRVAWVTAGRTLTVRGAGAVLPADAIRRFDEPIRVTGWAPDGSGVVVSRRMAATREDLWLVPIRGTGEPRPVVETPFADVQGVLSPDGSQIAYASDESGRFDVYVERVRDRSPGPGSRERVTSGGGSDPRWSADGRELFFRRGSEIHVATPALGRGQNAVATTSILFDTKADVRTFDVAPDGRRFLLNLPAVPSEAAPITVVVHWPRP